MIFIKARLNNAYVQILSVEIGCENAYCRFVIAWVRMGYSLLLQAYILKGLELDSG